MDLYLIRHADALALGENGIETDEERPLSEKGEKQSAAMGEFFKARGIAFDRVISSPLVRARQTTEIMLKSAGLSEEYSLADDLTPGARPKKTARHLMKVSGDRVALVGHLPHMAEFLAWMIGDKQAQIDFKKAGVARISTGDSAIRGNGVLHWLITPEWF